MGETADLPLKVLTGNSHLHTVEADSRKILDEIETRLARKGIYLKINKESAQTDKNHRKYDTMNKTANRCTLYEGQKEGLPSEIQEVF